MSWFKSLRHIQPELLTKTFGTFIMKHPVYNAINKTYEFFSSLGLSVNEKKTKVLIFNPRGVNLKNMPGYNFMCGANQLEVCDQYTYLGITLKSSGTFTLAVDELYSKASKAWFSISNIIYQNKKLPVSKAFRIFDSLITPITLYCCELWTPFTLKLGNLSQARDLLMNFGDFTPERLNQRISRMILSVHKKSSSLAVLGEMGRFPLLINALAHTLK